MLFFNLKFFKFILAVQHARDGLGKRINNLKQETPNFKILKPLSEKQQLNLLNNKSHNEFNLNNKNSLTTITNKNESDSFTTTIADTTKLNFLQAPNLSNNLTYSNAPTTTTSSVNELLLINKNGGSIFQLNSINGSRNNISNLENSAVAHSGFVPHNLIDNFIDSKQILPYMVIITNIKIIYIFNFFSN